MTLVNLTRKASVPLVSNPPLWVSNIELITPNLAEALLETNENNRNLRKSVVERYASIMTLGDWLLTPEPIVIADTGRLLNGQHRLNAVIKSGVNVRMFVVRNVSEQAFSAIDRGVSRTFSDAHGMNKKLVECAKLLIDVKSGDTRASTVDRNVLAETDFLRENHETLMAATQSTSRAFSSTSVRLAACIRMFDPSARDHVLAVYRGLVLGHTHELPPVAQAFVGAVAAGKFKSSGSTGPRVYLMLVAFSVFDPKNANQTRVPIITNKTLDNFMTAVMAGKACQAK
jgi:hypothetical protein